MDLKEEVFDLDIYNDIVDENFQQTLGLILLFSNSYDMIQDNLLDYHKQQSV